MISTIHGRHILSLFEEKKILSFAELKAKFIETKEMNQTTLYRILERFLGAGKIHRIEYDGMKFFTLCQCGDGKKGIKIRFCTSCHSVAENHFPTDTDAIRSETVEYLRTCTTCK